jgi:hypothetical protein
LALLSQLLHSTALLLKNWALPSVSSESSTARFAALDLLRCQLQSSPVYIPNKQRGITRIDFGVGFGLMYLPEQSWLG